MPSVVVQGGFELGDCPRVGSGQVVAFCGIPEEIEEAVGGVAISRRCFTDAVDRSSSPELSVVGGDSTEALAHRTVSQPFNVVFEPMSTLSVKFIGELQFAGCVVT